MNSVFINIDENVKNKSVLFISDDLEICEKLKENEESLNYKVLCFEENKFNLLTNKLNLFDVIIFDNRTSNDLTKFRKLFEASYKYTINIPLIVLDNQLENDIEIYKNCNVYAVLTGNICINQILSNISLCLAFNHSNRRVNLEEGYYFDMSRELLFLNKKMVKLTKTERALLKLLVERRNQLVTYETIEKIVWNDKKFSKYTLRNIVKHIREKSSNNIIRNSSNRGYVVNSQ